MVDRLTEKDRSALMARIRSKNTKPEIFVRKLIHALGFRFRLHAALPGTPDIVFPSRNKVVFVHGCYWHGHNCCRGRAPKSRLEYWGPKIAKNKARDAKNKRALTKLGWRYLVIWECETAKPDALQIKISGFLKS